MIYFEKEKQKRIAVVVVTYNRISILKKNISALLGQNRKPEEIIVINNSSTDGTLEWLNEQNGLTIINQENSGSAGGQYTGIKYAYEKGYDWIWCMDCDVVPQNDALLKLLSCDEIDDPKTGFLSSLVYFDTDNLAYPNIPELGKPYELLNAVYKHKSLPIISASFGSLLISRKVISKAGLPSKDFFIWGDDAEFTLRIIYKGFAGYLVLKSMAQHFNPSNSFTPYGELSPKDIKFKYGVRNMVYISILRNKITHNSKFRGLVSGLGFIFKVLKERTKIKKGISISYFSMTVIIYFKGILFKPKIEIPANIKSN